jgi:hypothetical protein
VSERAGNGKRDRIERDPTRGKWRNSYEYREERPDREGPCVVSLPVGMSCSSVELDQVLKDQLTPAISARLD